MQCKVLLKTKTNPNPDPNRYRSAVLTLMLWIQKFRKDCVSYSYRIYPVKITLRNLGETGLGEMGGHLFNRQTKKVTSSYAWSKTDIDV